LFLNQTIEEMWASVFVGASGNTETIVSKIEAFVHLSGRGGNGDPLFGNGRMKGGVYGDSETSAETSDVKTDRGNEVESWRRRFRKRPSRG
jgi:hypothetical protein